MLTIKAALTGVLALTAATTAALAEPKTNLLSQWSEGSDAAAIAKLGEMFTAAGGKWEQTSIAGHTANTLAKLRADVVAGAARVVRERGSTYIMVGESSPARGLARLREPLPQRLMRATPPGVDVRIVAGRGLRQDGPR